MNYKAIIERIVETSQDHLNDWELDFISDMYDKHVSKNWNLTEGQQNKILQINRKVLGKEE